MAKVRDWRVGVKVNLIGLTNFKFISTVIGSNLTICHVKLIFVMPLGSLGSKTWLERNVFWSQNLHPWNTEYVQSGALEGGLIFRRSLAFSRRCFEL